MQRVVTIFLLFFSIFSIIPFGSCEGPQSDSVRNLSLKDAIEIAYLNNKIIQIQEEEIAYAKAGIVGAVSNFLPKLAANYSYTYNGAAFTVSPALTANSKKDVGIFTGYVNDNKADLTVTESLFNGGADIATYKQSKLGLKVQQETLRARKLDVDFDAKRLYYGLLLAYEIERITEALLGQSKAHYDDVKSKFEQGTSSKFDLLQSSVQVSKVIPQVVKAKNNVDIIMAEFKKLLSIKQQEGLALKGHLGYSTIEIKEEDFLKEAYIGNPQMILKLLGIDIEKWSIEYAKAGWMPQVNANFGYTYRSNNLNTMFNYRHTDWAAGVSVGLSIFDSFSTKARVDEAKAKYAQARLEREDVEDQLAVDIKTACLDMKEAEEIIKSQRDSIVEAKDALRIAEIGYDNGVVTNLDVLDTQVSLSQVETNLSNAIYDYVMAKAFLDKTRGQVFVKEEGDEPH